MIVVGLTGSIGMGKTTVGNFFREEGVPVLDSDADVHALYAPGGAAVAKVEAAFPGVTRDGAVDRVLLGQAVLGDPDKLRRLEEIVHPLVAERRYDFLEAHREAWTRLVILDIPLLYESGLDEAMDFVVVVSAPPEEQRRRVLGRPGMTEEKLQAILAQQVSDEDKRARADFVIDTSGPLDRTREQVRNVLDAIREQA